jgi:methionine aminopeptidase
MTIEREDQLDKLRAVGNLVARTLAAMGEALEPGMTTKELDDFGRALLEREGARSAPNSPTVSPARPASRSAPTARTASRTPRR